MNKFIKKILLILLIYPIIIFLSISCNKLCSGYRVSIESSGVTINLFNTANNEYFYPENKRLSPYNIDSLTIRDSKENLLQTDFQLNSDPRNPLKKFYVVQAYPIFKDADDEEAFNNEETKFLYIKYNYNTFDTLQLTFKAKKEKCGNVFEYLKVYYKDSLLLNGQNTTDAFILTLNH